MQSQWVAKKPPKQKHACAVPHVPDARDAKHARFDRFQIQTNHLDACLVMFGVGVPGMLFPTLRTILPPWRLRLRDYFEGHSKNGFLTVSPWMASFLALRAEQNSAELVDVVRYQLRTRGTIWECRCPFHRQRKASHQAGPGRPSGRFFYASGGTSPARAGRHSGMHMSRARPIFETHREAEPTGTALVHISIKAPR